MRPSTHWFILVLILGFTNVVQAKGVVVIGDSLSAMEDSWPSYIYGHHIGLMAQGGRTIRDFDIPRDIFAGIPFTTAVYFLGANDAAQGYRTYFAHGQFKTHIRLLQRRYFNVVVIIPPLFTNSPYEIENFVKLRREMFTLCSQMELNCHDSMDVWDNDLVAEDGVHPLPELSSKLGYWMQDIIDMEENQ